jgi:general secretion pathway protein C
MASLPSGVTAVDHNAPMLKRPFSQRMALRQNLSSPGPTGGSRATGRTGAAWAGGLIWLAAGLCAGYWVLQASGQGPWVSLQGLAPSAPQADVATVGRALGSAPDAAAPTEAAPVSAARFRLLGVVAQGPVIGAALLAVGDQPPRPWPVGAEVADGLVLQSVDRNGAKLGESRWGETTLELVMPEPTEPPQRPAVKSAAVSRPVARPPRPVPPPVPQAEPVAGTPPSAP